ncbi:uncharacterized protein LOC100375653 [Saccoglossus kowalevskii]|uniref:Uncharacterized protein LOC100375653 n=1 Tax=Saccoglossus kowalevskii TaxID=10224 RepID=A0ABM0GIQ8_SACKO|nr:PREDICTED: uncharacterized protein LOC100375653 [Saccoglossus kowalevskii]
MNTEFCYRGRGNVTSLSCECSDKPPEFKLPKPQYCHGGNATQMDSQNLLIACIVLAVLFIIIIIVIVVMVKKRQNQRKGDTSVMLNASRPITNSQSSAQPRYNMDRTDNPVYERDLDSEAQNKRIQNSSRLSSLDGHSLSTHYPIGTDRSGDSGFVDNANTGDDFPLNKMPSSHEEETSPGFARGNGMLWRNQPQWQQGVQQRTAMI